LHGVETYGAFKANKQTFISLIFTHNLLLVGSRVSAACLERRLATLQRISAGSPHR